jgi:hypothetical protein
MQPVPIAPNDARDGVAVCLKNAKVYPIPDLFNKAGLWCKLKKKDQE